MLKLSEIAGGPKAGDILCTLSQIEDGKAREFEFRSGSDLVQIFIQRRGNEIFAYHNCCPHAGSPLNMEDTVFMERSGTYLMCHTHGALFTLEDGLCVGGPCTGQSLQPVSIVLKEGKLIVE